MINLKNEIESIKPQKGNQSRYNIRFESGNVLGVSVDVLMNNKLVVGKKVSTKDYQKIKTDENHYSIKTKALNFLSYRPRSIKEVEISLLKKGFDSDSISIVLDELIQKRYLNDEDFARAFATHLIKNKMLGKIAVYNRFFIHQIEQDLLNSILEELYGEYQPKDLIMKIVEKKGSHSNTNPIKDRKMVDHLKRKGYSWSEISSALNS